MKIAYLLDTYPSPTETFLAREIAALRRRGLEIEVFAFHAGKGATSINPASIARFWPNRWQMVGANWAKSLAGFDHIHAGWANHLAIVAQSASRKSGIKWSFSAHARDLWVEGGDLKAKMASAEFVTCCTRSGAAQLLKFGSNVIYAPHGLELERYKFRQWKPRQPFRIIGVGRLVEKKGWFNAIEAVKNINQSRAQSTEDAFEKLSFTARLLLVGDGPLRADFQKHGLQTVEWRKAHDLRRDAPVSWYGALPHSQTIKVMRSCDCLILPSLRTNDGDRDGLANVLLEAGALGLPIITTNAGGASDFVDDTTGIVIEAGDVQALTKAIKQVFDEPEKTIERCQNARDRVAENFDIDKNIAVLCQLLRA